MKLMIMLMMIIMITIIIIMLLLSAHFKVAIVAKGFNVFLFLLHIHLFNTSCEFAIVLHKLKKK